MSILWHHHYHKQSAFNFSVGEQTNINDLVRSVIERIAVGPDRGRDISRVEAKRMMSAVLRGQVDEVQVAVILIALRMKRESMDEFLGIFDALQSCVEPVVAPVNELFCLADPFDGYLRCLPMTPFIPAVLAACEMPALLIGVESVGPKYGVTAQQVYALAGINVGASAARTATCVAQTGWGYLDQQIFAPQLYQLRDLREKMVKRSALTTLERLMMPVKAAGSTHSILGYVHKAYQQIYAQVAKTAGYHSSLLCKGVEGGLAPALNKPLRQTWVDFSSGTDEQRATRQDLPSVVVADSAAYSVTKLQRPEAAATLELGLQTLGGERSTARNSLILAAAQILAAYGRADSLSAAVEKVANCLDNGSAMNRFNSLRNRK